MPELRRTSSRGLPQSGAGEMLLKIIKEAEKLNLLNISDNWIKPTKKGYSFLNELQEIFL